MKYDHPGHDAHHRLFNPLAAEFGIRTPSELQSMLDSSLNHFLLVSLGQPGVKCFRDQNERESSVDETDGCCE